MNLLCSAALDSFHTWWIQDDAEYEAQDKARILSDATLLVPFLSPRKVVLGDLHALLSFLSPVTLNSPLKDKLSPKTRSSRYIVVLWSEDSVDIV